jgi:hypothetical protein
MTMVDLAVELVGHQVRAPVRYPNVTLKAWRSETADLQAKNVNASCGQPLGATISGSALPVCGASCGGPSGRHDRERSHHVVVFVLDDVAVVDVGLRRGHAGVVPPGVPSGPVPAAAT